MEQGYMPDRYESKISDKEIIEAFRYDIILFEATGSWSYEYSKNINLPPEQRKYFLERARELGLISEGYPKADQQIDEW